MSKGLVCKMDSPICFRHKVDKSKMTFLCEGSISMGRLCEAVGNGGKWSFPGAVKISRSGIFALRGFNVSAGFMEVGNE